MSVSSLIRRANKHTMITHLETATILRRGRAFCKSLANCSASHKLTSQPVRRISIVPACLSTDCERRLSIRRCKHLARFHAVSRFKLDPVPPNPRQSSCIARHTRGTKEQKMGLVRNKIMIDETGNSSTTHCL